MDWVLAFGIKGNHPILTIDAAASEWCNRARITVVGAGHSLLLEDRIGPRVLELLDGRYGPDVELRDLGTTALGLLDHLAGQELMIIVDACLSGRNAGEVVEIAPDLDAVPSRNTSVHQIGPLETLLVAKHLYPERLPRRMLLLLVETGGIDLETEQRACQEVVRRIDNHIRELC